MNKHDQEFLVQKIRTQYTEKEHSSLDELKRLDAKVKRPAYAFAWAFGTVGAMVLGAGMSLVMTDLGSVLGLAQPMVPGVAVGIVGLAMVIANYPIFKGILTARRKKYAGEIIALSDRITG